MTIEETRVNYIQFRPCRGLETPSIDVAVLTEQLAFLRADLARQVAIQEASCAARVTMALAPDTWQPRPAMTLVKAMPTGSLTDPIELPAGEVFWAGGELETSTLLRSLESLRLLPIELESVDTHDADVEAGTQLLRMRFRPLIPRANFAPGRVRLHVHHEGGYATSLELWSWLKKAALTSRAYFDDATADTSTCEFHFGPRKTADKISETQARMEARGALSLPHAELFIDFDVGLGSDVWRSFTIELEIGSNFPRRWRIGADQLHLHCIALENVIESIGEIAPEPDPLATTTTTARIHSGLDHNHNLVHVRYLERDTGEVSEKLRPGAVANESACFEQDTLPAEDGSPLLRIAKLRSGDGEAEAVLEARVVADWYTPEFSHWPAHHVQLRTYHRHIDGVQWAMVGTIAGHRSSALRADDRAGLEALLKMRRTGRLNIDALRCALEALGCNENSPFATMSAAIRRIESTPKLRCEAGQQSMVTEVKVHLDRGAIDLHAAQDPKTYPRWLCDRLAAHLEPWLESWLRKGSLRICFELDGDLI